MCIRDRNIESQVPEMIAYRFDSLGLLANADQGDGEILANNSATGIFQSNDSRIDHETDFIKIDKSEWLSNGGSKLDFSADKNVQSGDGISLFISWRTSNNENSERYKVTMIDTEGENYQLRLARKISLEDAKLASFSGTANQTTTNTLATGLQFTVEDRTKREKEDFDGKFFVKVSADTVVKSTVIQESEDTLGDFYYSSQQGVRWFADPQTSDTHTNGELDGLYNQDPYLGTPESAPENITLDTTVTDTEDAWDSLVSDSAVGKGFFIDNMAFVAAQTSVSNYARFAAQAFSANFVTYSRPIWNEGSFYADGSVSGTFDSWIFNTSTAPNVYLNTTNVDDWQLRISNGMDGIVQTNSRHVGDTEDTQGSIVGSRRWRDNIYSSSGSAYDNTYKEEPGKIFMHLSFLAPGKDLHDGSFSDTTASLSNTDTYGPNSIAKDLQGVWGGGIFTKQDGTKFGSSSLYGRIVEFEGNYSSQLNNGLPNPLEEAASPDEGQGYDNSYQSLHERQWDPTFALNENPSTLEFVNNLVAGRKFKFSDDTSNTIYTIKSVAIKKLYNHTPWKARYIYDGSDIVLAQDSVEEAAVDWAVAKANNSNDINSKASVLKERIVDFGRANNRRVCYVLELDKDPREASFNPVSGGSGNVDVNTPTTMQFVSANPPILSGITNRFPGIVETEPKDNLGLNIYYEASSAIPTKLNIDNVLNFAPIGSEVVFNIPEATTGQRLVTQSIHVARWGVVTDENLLVFYARPKDLSNNGFNKFDANGDIISYNNAEVRFYKDDGSYNTTVVLSAFDIGNQMATSTQTYDDLGVQLVFIVKRELDTTKKFGLGWNNCYVFGDSIESNRIRDDFNQTFISNGAKASTTIEEPYAEERRKSGLIYSGIYNSNTGKNNLNQFIQAEKITKDLNPTYGSIQKLFSRNTDLVSFCEDRVVKILANKDALFNADGNVNVVATSNVLGQVVPFVGEYGISKNPESFASESYRAYFTDEKRGAVLRLSMDGLTPISAAGMRDYFRDNLRNYSKILGSYDDFKKEFNLTLCHEYPENIITNEFLTVGDEQQSVLQTLEIVENPDFNLGTDLTLVNINDLFTGGYQKLNNTSFNHTVEIINHDELVVPGTIGQALIPDISQQLVSYEAIPGQGGRVMYRWRGKGVDTSPNNNPFISPGAGQIAFDSIFGKGGGGGQSYLDQNDVSQGLANEDIDNNSQLIYYKESASNNAQNNTIDILEDVIIFRNIGPGGFDDYIQVPGAPTSGSYPNNSVNNNLLDDVDEQGNQRGFPDAHNMQCYAGEEVEVIVRFGAIGTGNNENALAFRIYDGSTLLSSNKIYNPGTDDGNDTPYADNGIPFDSTDSGDINTTNNLGYRTTSTVSYQGFTGSFGAGGQFSDKVLSFRLKFKKPGTDPKDAQENDDTAAKTNLEFSEKVVENLQIRISKSSAFGSDTVFISDIFIYKNYRLVQRGYPFQAGQPFIESVPDLIVPAWAEVKQNNPSNWTASNNAINLTFGGEQVYGPSNPGVNETYNGQQYFNGSSNGVTDYNEFADGTYDVTGWTSEIHADTTNLSPNNTQYLTQSLSNPLEYNHWYVLDLEYGEGFNVDGDPNTVLVYGVAPYSVQTSVPGAVVGEQDSTISNSGYGTNEESNNPYYPEGFFGGVSGYNLIGSPKSISLKPVIRTEYGAPGAAVYRCIFKFVEDSYAGGTPTYGGTSGVNSNGTSFTTTTISNPGAALKIGFYNVDFKYKSAILIDITDTSTGGIVQDWSAAGFGSSVNHALDTRKMFYNNGGFNWNIPAQSTYVNDKYIRQDHSEGSVEYPYYNETNEGYELAFEIQKCDFQDQEVSGALRVAVRNHDSLGVDLRKIDKEGSYKVQYNYNDNQPTLLESPENSLVEVGPASSGIGAAVDEETTLIIRPDISNNNNSEFIGKLSKFSITRKENILSGGNIGAWDIVSVTQDNPEIFFENQAITFENAPQNAQIRQAISSNLEVGKTYKLEFNFSQFTSGKLRAYYFNPLNGEGFITTISAEDSEQGFFSENVVIGSFTGSASNAWGVLLFFCLGPEQLNVSIDNISLTEVLYDLAEETTVSFSEDVKGWTSFKSFIPDQAISCTSKYFSFSKARLYEHYVGDYNVFYDVFNESFVEFLFNQGPSSIKNFKTISYEGEEGWIATISTKEDDGFINEFIKKEDKWYNYIRGQQNDYYDGNNVQGLGVVSSIVSLTSDEGDITEDF